MSDETTPEPQRKAFEADAAQYGFDLRRISTAAPEPWSEYADPATGHRWGGWLAASERSDRLLSALRKLVNEPQDITSKAYQHALGVLGEFDSQQEK